MIKKFFSMFSQTPEQLAQASGKYDYLKIVTSEPLDRDSLMGLAESVVVQERPRRRDRSDAAADAFDFGVPALLRLWAVENGHDAARVLSACSAA